MVWIFTISLLLLFICLLMLNQYLRKYRFWLQQHVEVISTWGLLRRTRKVQLYQAIREIYVRLCREHKPFAVIESYFISTVIVQDQQAIKEVLTSQFENFPDRGFYVNRRDPLMVNLVRIHYDLWKPLRGKLTPAFSPAKLKYFYPTMAAVGDQLVQVLTAHILNDDAVVELRDLCKRFAMDVIGTVAFGIECNSLKNPQAELKVECDKAFLQHFRPFLDQFGEKYSKFLNFINYKYHSEESINFFTNLVKEALEYREKYNVRRRDFLDLLIEFRQDREGFPLSLEMIVGQVFIFFIGGYESSSSALCQALYELSKNPEIQEKARQEVLQTMKLNDNKLTYDSLKSLKYIKQVAQGKQ